MDAPAPSPAGPAGDPHFGIGRLFLSDARLAAAVGDELRHRGLHRVFGIPREEANLLTAVLLLGVASATYETAQRVVHTPVPFTRTDAYAGVGLIRAMTAGVAGPSAAATPGFGKLMTLAVLGGLALPALRRAAHAARMAERRTREHRIARYIADSRLVALAQSGASADA